MSAEAGRTFKEDLIRQEEKSSPTKKRDRHQNLSEEDESWRSEQEREAKKALRQRGNMKFMRLRVKGS